jgi:hypothetical protein
MMVQFQEIPDKGNSEVENSPNDSVDQLTHKVDNWSEESLAKLIGFEEDDTSNPAAVSPELSTQPENGDNLEPDSPILSIEELFDETQPEPQPMSQKGWSKGALVGSGLLVVFVCAGLVLSPIMDGIQPSPQTASKPEPSPTPKVMADEQGNPNGKLKTELALSQQAEELEKIDEARQRRSQDEQEGVQPGETEQNPESKAQTPQRAPVRRTPPPPAPAPRRTVARAPAPRPQPRRSSALSQVTTPTMATAPSSPRSQVQPEVTPSPKPTDPMERWTALAQLGSYGQVQAENGEAQGVQLSQERQMRRVSVPSADQVLPQESVVIAEAVDTLPPSTEVVLAEAESRILQGRPIRRATVGTMASGELMTPVIWSGEGNTEGRFVVTLNQPLLDRLGVEVLPAGTQVVFEIANVAENGLVQANALSVVKGDWDYALPDGALVVRGSGGEPLVAQDWFDHGDEIASMDVSTALLGALTQVGEVINRPESQTSTSITNGISSTTTTSQTSEPNIWAAVLEGGATPILEQIMERNQSAIARLDEMETLWYVEAGAGVQVFVNQSFTL